MKATPLAAIGKLLSLCFINRVTNCLVENLEMSGIYQKSRKCQCILRENHVRKNSLLLTSHLRLYQCFLVSPALRILLLVKSS